MKQRNKIHHFRFYPQRICTK